MTCPSLPSRRRLLRWCGAAGTAAVAPLALLQACGGGGGAGTAAPQGKPQIVAVSSSLESPWGLDFLPDDRMLVTQKAGTMLLLSKSGKRVEARLEGLPAVTDAGQGGLLDVLIDPDFADDPWVYWTYAEPGEGDEEGLSGTAVARGLLKDDRLESVEVIFRQQPKIDGSAHFGARLAFGQDGRLFVALGERQQDDPADPGRRYAQNLANHLGKVVRIERDGGIPDDNPSFDDEDALPGIWSYGHRNPQGAAVHPDTGELWLTEHGPQGGDELNRVVAGGNYGWPLRSYGCPYGDPVGEACQVNGGTHAPDFVEPATDWVPTSIAPSGLMFYTGDGFTEWQGQAFIGALAGQALWRIEFDGRKVVDRNRMFHGQDERIRCVRQGPDGWIYLLTDSGKLLRIER